MGPKQVKSHYGTYSLPQDKPRAGRSAIEDKLMDGGFGLGDGAGGGGGGCEGVWWG